jgi:hypothetical protein
MKPTTKEPSPDYQEKLAGGRVVVGLLKSSVPERPAIDDKPIFSASLKKKQEISKKASTNVDASKELVKSKKPTGMLSEHAGFKGGMSKKRSFHSKEEKEPISSTTTATKDLESFEMEMDRCVNALKTTLLVSLIS